MFCAHCGVQVEDHFKFCSRCGGSLEVQAAGQKKVRDMEMHVKILAWLLVGSAVLLGILGITGMVASQLITSLPIPWPPDLPFEIIGFAGWVAAMVGFVMVLTATATAAAGVGLLYYKTWGRVLAIITCITMLIKIPLGTAIGIYGLWVLFSKEGREHYEERARTQLA